jgi:hypothetical protein
MSRHVRGGDRSTRTARKERNVDLTREEQETIIRSNAASKTWEVVTADPRIIRKMDKQGYHKDERRNPAEYVSYTIPFDRIRILKAEKRKVTGRPFAKRTEDPTDPANSREISDQND